MASKICCNEFSKSIFWAGVEEFLFKSIISFVHFFYNMFTKNEKNLTAKKSFIVCAFPETEHHINSFHFDLPSPYHLKTSGFLYF